jgi:serine/threonine protein kinase, bacterial
MTKLGATIGGRYQVIEHVGRGGMQEVYRARDKLLEVDVALKTPQAGQAAKRFKTSALIAARVNHYNVAKTLDYFEDEGVEYLVEEFIPGETLDHKLKTFGYLDPHLGARVLHHLAKGVAASHRVNVVHRDLKPSNVMVTEGVNLHQLKITDFGIATLTKDVFDKAANAGDITLSNSGTIKGALPFMAPEMMFRKPGDNPGESVDIWSVGAMMFQLLTGDYPFGVYLEAAVNVKNRDRKAWPLFMIGNSQYAPLARELQAVVDSCLEYDPAARPSAQDIVNRCENLCYLSVERHEGIVQNLIQNNYSGFITGNHNAFFSMESVYGDQRPNTHSNKHVCYSSFPGSPHPRAHPVVVIKK